MLAHRFLLRRAPLVGQRLIITTHLHRQAFGNTAYKKSSCRSYYLQTARCYSSGTLRTLPLYQSRWRGLATATFSYLVRTIAVGSAAAYALAYMPRGNTTTMCEAAQEQAKDEEEDDDAPASEGDVTESDEREETLEALRKQILSEHGMRELNANPVMHDSHLAWSTLHGPGKFEEVTMFYNAEKEEIAGVFHFGDNICGHREIVHGGALAVSLDETLGWLAHLVAKRCFTAYLHINYRKPVPSSTLCVIRGHVDRIEGRKIFLKGALYDHTGVLHADATALFVVPRNFEFHHPAPVLTEQTE